MACQVSVLSYKINLIFILPIFFSSWSFDNFIVFKKNKTYSFSIIWIRKEIFIFMLELWYQVIYCSVLKHKLLFCIVIEFVFRLHFQCQEKPHWCMKEVTNSKNTAQNFLFFNVVSDVVFVQPVCKCHPWEPIMMLPICKCHPESVNFNQRPLVCKCHPVNHIIWPVCNITRIWPVWENFNLLVPFLFI